MVDGWAVAHNGRYLQRGEDHAFFLGDTAWELIHRLTRGEADHYFRRRADQGFTVSLVVAVAEFDGMTVPTPEGHLPFRDGDVAQPDPDYWTKVDDVVRMAAAAGITVGLLPTWGRWWHDIEDGGSPLLLPSNARRYGEFLGERYAGADIVWVLGGDRYPDTPDQFETIRLLAEGIRARAHQLMTFHPRGSRSSTDSHLDAPFLDFDMIQSGHSGWANPNYQYVEQDLQRSSRPTMDAEPNYEHHPVMTPQWKPLPVRFSDADARRSAYHAVFAGAGGHVYGCHDVWQMFDPARRNGPTEPINEASLPWREALELPGAVQMGYLATLWRDKEIWRFRPDQSLIVYDVGVAGAHKRAMRGESGEILVYLPHGGQVTLSTPVGTAQLRRFVPTTGEWNGSVTVVATAEGRLSVDSGPGECVLSVR